MVEFQQSDSDADLAAHDNPWFGLALAVLCQSAYLKNGIQLGETSDGLQVGFSGG